MDALTAMTASLSPETMVVVMSAFVFVAVSGLFGAVFIGLNSRRALRDRLGETGTLNGGPGGNGAANTRSDEMRLLQQFVESAARKVLPSDQRNLKMLRQDLIRAGIFDAKAVGIYFLARLALAVVAGGGALIFAPIFLDGQPASHHWLAVGAGIVGGYYLPSYYLRGRIKRRIAEHRNGFPDFLDLLVVCADAGLSTEAAIDRVALELAHAYPSLSTNLSLCAIEIRAGSTIIDALEHLADRLGLEEARTFATLLQQSEEYGSSLTDSLRVYSEDMRHARMSRAEEKANSLPSKMTLPLMLFIFPVILVVVMLPVVVRYSESGFGG